MGDFFQSKSLITLSNINHTDYQRNFIKRSRTSKLVVLIPCLYHHYEKGYLSNLLNALVKVDYLTEIVVVLNGEKKDSGLIIDDLYTIDLRITFLIKDDENAISGKGSALFFGFSYIYQKYQDSAIVSTIDADIKNFSSSFLSKLFYPLVECSADFNKAYYVRYSEDELNGRLTRLLIFPLLHAMREQYLNSPILDFLLEFRYPLSGEIAIKSNFLKDLCIKPNWSYDLSLLVAMYQYPKARIFQTEITHNFSHDHREITSNAHHGLLPIAQDIVIYLMSLAEFQIDVLVDDYLYYAHLFCDKYIQLAAFNGLKVNLHQEKMLINAIKNIF